MWLASSISITMHMILSLPSTPRILRDISKASANHVFLRARGAQPDGVPKTFKHIRWEIGPTTYQTDLRETLSRLPSPTSDFTGVVSRSSISMNY